MCHGSTSTYVAGGRVMGVLGWVCCGIASTYVAGGRVVGVSVHDRWVCRGIIIEKVNAKSD